MQMHTNGTSASASTPKHTSMHRQQTEQFCETHTQATTHTASNFFVLESRKDRYCLYCEPGTQPASQPLSHAINHSTSQPTTQPANQPINQQTNHSIGASSHSGSQPATQRNQSLKQTTNHSTIKPTTPPANPAPTRQLITHFRREDAQ